LEEGGALAGINLQRRVKQFADLPIAFWGHTRES
jgi:hypothetical protein